MGRNASNIRMVVNNDEIPSNTKPANDTGKVKAEKKTNGNALLRYSVRNHQRVEDAIALAGFGLGLRGIQQLTKYPLQVATHIISSSGTKTNSGRRKSSVAEIIRNPLFHAALGMYVVNLEKILQASDGQLNVRTFVTSVRQFNLATNGTLVQLHCDLLYAVASSYIAGTTEIRYCTSCRCNYAHISTESGLVRDTIYECPQCREFAALIGGTCAVSNNAQCPKPPSNMSQMNLKKPLTRFNSTAPPPALIRGTLQLLVG